MPGTQCEVCGFEPKNPRSLYFSAMFNQTRCVNGAACQTRAAKAQKEKT